MSDKKRDRLIAAKALEDAAKALGKDWVKNGRHQGIPGCYSSGYEHWLLRRAAALREASA